MARENKNVAMPRGKGREALAIWARRREDAVRQRCKNLWHTKDAMVALEIFLNVREVSEWMALMAEKSRHKYEQKGSNGGTEIRLFSKVELKKKEDDEFRRLHKVLLVKHGNPTPNSTAVGSAHVQFQPQPAVKEDMATSAPAEPPPSSTVPTDSPASGVSYPNLAGTMSVQVMVLSAIFQAVKLGWITTTALRAAIQRELGWENSTPQGIGRMLGFMRDSLGFLESRDDGSVRDYRVSRSGAIKVLGMSEEELLARGSIASPPILPPAPPPENPADLLRREIGELRDHLEGIEDWHYRQTVSRIVTELMGFPPEAREGILADVRERMK